MVGSRISLTVLVCWLVSPAADAQESWPQFRGPAMSLATPAIAGGSLFIRTASRLFRIEEPSPEIR